MKADIELALRLGRMIDGFQTTRAIHAAALIGMTDLLAAGPRDIPALATATNTHPQPRR
jgi:hypothetical protein